MCKASHLNTMRVKIFVPLADLVPYLEPQMKTMHVLVPV